MQNTLLISTYNWPAALDICLKSVLRQTKFPDEVIIADDGSSDETKSLVSDHAASFPVPLIHVWHEDKGFRKSEILNKSLAKARGNYIIQVDGDVMLHKQFIKDHLSFAKPDSFVIGSRMNTSENLMKEIIEKQMFELSPFTPGLKNFFNGLRIPFSRNFLEGYQTSERKILKVRGCNMAYWKNDLLKVNGYNEKYEGWGMEDSDLALRLHYAGVRKRFLKMGGLVYHLWHPHASRDQLENNIDTLENVITSKIVRAEKGIDQYIKAN